jgi:hypothetical protein
METLLCIVIKLPHVLLSVQPHNVARETHLPAVVKAVKVALAGVIFRYFTVYELNKPIYVL